MNRKRMTQASMAGARKSGIFASARGGQDISARLMTMEEKAELVADLAEGSDPGLEPAESLIISLVRSNPDFVKEDERKFIALGVLGIFDSLSEDEMDAALELNGYLADAGLDGGRWDAVKLSLIPEEYRPSVAEISQALRDEAESKGGQMPILLCEHAKRIVKEMDHLSGRREIEKAAWDLDEDIGRNAREALDIISGRSSYRANIIVDSLSRCRVSDLGVGGAIAEVAELWQGLRNEGVEDKTARDAILAFGYIQDDGVEPTFGALNLLSEISREGAGMADPREMLLSVIAAAKRAGRKKEPS